MRKFPVGRQALATNEKHHKKTGLFFKNKKSTWTDYCLTTKPSTFATPQSYSGASWERCHSNSTQSVFESVEGGAEGSEKRQENVTSDRRKNFHQRQKKKKISNLYERSPRQVQFSYVDVKELYDGKISIRFPSEMVERSLKRIPFQDELLEAIQSLVRQPTHFHHLFAYP